MRVLITGSSRERARVCPASAVLPRFRSTSQAALLGSVVHAHLEHRVIAGLDYAMESLEALCCKFGLDEQHTQIAIARCRSFEWSPPAGARTEISLALFTDRHVEQCGGGRGEYHVEGAIFAMTIDVMWEENGILWVADYKTGDEDHVPPVERNAQMQAAALLASQYTRFHKVMPAIIFVGPGQGTWDTAEAPWGAAELAVIERDIRAEHAAVLEAQEHLDVERHVVEGTHCTYCPAQSSCPAKVRMIKYALADDRHEGELTPAQAVYLAQALPQLDAFVRRGKQALRAMVEATGQPIPLGDGTVWGPHDVERTEINPRIGVEVLSHEMSLEDARKALSVELSRSAIEEAVKAAHAQQRIKRQATAVIRRVMAQIDASSGITKRVETWWSAYRPKSD